MGMGYQIKCTKQCKDDALWAENIIELLNDRDEKGFFKAGCGHAGFVERSYALQEKGETWEPYLRGAVNLGAHGDVYQPSSTWSVTTVMVQ